MRERSILAWARPGYLSIGYIRVTSIYSLHPIDKGSTREREREREREAEREIKRERELEG